MNTFTDTLKAGLDAGETYVDLINQLIETDDAEQLLGAANKLSVYELKNDFVKYPFQYQPQDYYLVLASRLLQFHNNESLETSIDDAGAVSARLNQLGNSAKFQFVMDKSKNGGALFTETKTNEALFYLNLQKRMMRFNNRSLVNLFVEKLSEVTTIIQISAHTNPNNSIYLFFRKKQSEGKHHYKCIVACETKLCKIIYKLCTSDCLYENK